MTVEKSQEVLWEVGDPKQCRRWESERQAAMGECGGSHGAVGEVGSSNGGL